MFYSIGLISDDAYDFCELICTESFRKLWHQCLNLLAPGDAICFVDKLLPDGAKPFVVTWVLDFD